MTGDPLLGAGQSIRVRVPRLRCSPPNQVQLGIYNIIYGTNKYLSKEKGS